METDSVKMILNSSSPNSNLFIDELSVDNKEFFEQIKEDLTCLICHGLLYDPKLCANCEIAYCNNCITKWSKLNNQCLTRCSEYLTLKNIGRTLRNLLDKVIIKCQYGCLVSLSLYPTHIIPCHEKNKIVECWCCNVLNKKLNIKIQEKDFITLQNKLKEYEDKLTSLESEKKQSIIRIH